MGSSNPNESVKDCMEKFKVKMRGSLKCLKQVELPHLEALIKHLGFIKAKLLVGNRYV